MRRLPTVRLYLGRWRIVVIPTGDSLFGYRITGGLVGSVGLKLAVVTWMRRVPAASSWSVKLVRPASMRGDGDDVSTG